MSDYISQKVMGKSKIKAKNKAVDNLLISKSQLNFSTIQDLSTLVFIYIIQNILKFQKNIGHTFS
jgi:hypothetical protein